MRQSLRGYSFTAILRIALTTASKTDRVSSTCESASHVCVSPIGNPLVTHPPALHQTLWSLR
jgi:hypothetical protein